MQDSDITETSARESLNEVRFFACVAWGLLMGGLTFAAGPLTALSANPLVAGVQLTFSLFLIPGLFCAAMAGSLIPGAFINAVFHFGISWLVLTLVSRLRRGVRAGR